MFFLIMPNKVKHWISAFRVRTLFLSIAAVILGTGLAMHESEFSINTTILALLLAITIQVLSNLSNDLGDFIKGTDITGKREGPVRAVQSGNITPKQMKIAIIINIIVVIFIGLSLIFTSIHNIDIKTILILIGVGLICILAALFYTIGKSAYGYSGWGDFFAFLFFGPVAVLGTYFLHTNQISPNPIAPSIGLGLISTMILNVNNMRDIENDKTSGKITVASIIGLRNAKIYHLLMTIGVFISFVNYNISDSSTTNYTYIYTLVFVFLLAIMKQISKKENRELDPFLKQTSIAGLLLAILFSVCINI